MTAAVDRVLPAGPATAARHPLFIATGAVVAAGTMLMFGMLAVWFKFRDASPLRVGRNNRVKRFLRTGIMNLRREVRWDFHLEIV